MKKIIKNWAKIVIAICFVFGFSSFAFAGLLTAGSGNGILVPLFINSTNDNTGVIPFNGLNIGSPSQPVPKGYFTSIIGSGNFGISTSTPDSSLDVNGNIRLEGSSTVITPSISGTITTSGCDSATSSVDSTVSSSTAFITTPQTYPGDKIWWESYFSAPSTITTKVCADVTATPVASTYVVKILK